MPADARAFLASVALRAPSEIADDIFDLSPSGGEPAHYDAMGKLYDTVCGTWAYNRMVWGTTPVRSTEFAERVFASRAAGAHVELGCGGLLFTAPLYDADRGRPSILIDPSLAMLRMARSRLRKRHGRVPPYVALVRGDGRDLPLAAGFATTVLSMHVLHVVAEREAFLRTLSSLAAADGATIGLTSLVRTGRFRDGFLAALHRAGELSAPQSAAELEGLIASTLPGERAVERRGNMVFVTAKRA